MKTFSFGLLCVVAVIFYLLSGISSHVAYHVSILVAFLGGSAAALISWRKERRISPKLAITGAVCVIVSWITAGAAILAPLVGVSH